ncbi:MAG: MBL fold metallo-hydrolase [Bacteroidaceae bacterium]|nr:MBL fold metallo-hydrolase [Bacteroidaceae bacterium]
MRITFLGTGTSIGVPMIGCHCEVCRSLDPRDRRMRTSAIVEEGDTRILIDCGPDFREQMLRIDVDRSFDAILITHEHSDHVDGIDDLRPSQFFGEVDIYADEFCAKHLIQRMPYCFLPKEQRYKGVPELNMHVAEPHEPITIGSMTIIPFRVMHGKLPILGFRINDLVYITDMSLLPETEYVYAKDASLLVENALRPITPHPTHQRLEEALVMAETLNAKQTYLVHMCHEMGFHAVADAQLPPNIHYAYDGLSVDF